MRRDLHRSAPFVISTLILIAWLDSPAAAQTAASPSPTVPDRSAESRVARAADRARLEKLDVGWRTKDFATIDAIFDEAWKTDRSWALESSHRLAVGEDTAARPLGIAQLALHVTPSELLKCLRGFDQSRARAERRTLVMLSLSALTTAPAADARAVAAALLADQDQVLRAAAATLAGVRQDAALTEALLPLLRENPTFKPKWDGDEEDILQSRAYGAFEAVWGVRPRSANEAGALLRVTVPFKETPARGSNEPLDEPSAPAPPLVSEPLRGRPYFPIRHFLINFEFGNDRTGGSEMARAVEAFAAPEWEAMIAAAEPVFGPLPIASPRLIIADRARYSSVGGNSFRPGSGTGNQIALLESVPDAMAATVRHECVHVLHGASFERQPRWLSEGLAESLSISTGGSVWTPQTIRERQFDDELEKGVFTELLGWKGPASSGGRESRLYAMAHLAVDFLRFGPHAAPHARLHLFMAKLGDHQSDRTTLERLYGGTVKEIDRALADWVGGR